MSKWSIAEAKANFSRVINEARTEAQSIQNRGVAVAVVIDADAYQALLGRAEQTMPAERLGRFLRVSEAIRSAGGATLAVTKRKARPSPFAARKR